MLAADWTGVLINMNAGNVDASLQKKLHDETVGELNADFDASAEPYRAVVQTLQSRTTGQIKSVAVESVHQDLDTALGSPLPEAMAQRTDTVLVVAALRLAAITLMTAALVAGVLVGDTRWTVPDRTLKTDAQQVVSLASAVSEATAPFSPRRIRPPRSTARRR